jgi:PAS domain S-box-containing protein
MPRYDLVLKPERGRRAERIALDCPSDEAARDAAEVLVGEHSAELRAEDRLVRAWAGAPVQASRERVAAWLATPLSSAVGAAVIATSPRGTVLHWDRNAVRLYGWSAADALGRDIVELTPATQSRLDAVQVMDTLRSGQPWQGEMVLRDKAGRPFRAWVLDVPLGDVAGGAGVIVGISLPLAERAAIADHSEAIEAELHRRFEEVQVP